jgi:hypothetical protein
MISNEDAYHELCCYTLARGDPEFVHQYVVDAFAAQHADEQTKPIKLTFALIGLYLHVEKKFSGRAVQRAHQLLAQKKRSWPSFPLPSDRGTVTVADVIAVPAGRERDAAIHDWCVSVWNAYRDSHRVVAELLVKLNFDA